MKLLPQSAPSRCDNATMKRTLPVALIALGGLAGSATPSFGAALPVLPTELVGRQALEARRRWSRHTPLGVQSLTVSYK
jgi:hypothetical protein